MVDFAEMIRNAANPDRAVFERLQQAMPRLYMASVLQQYRAEVGQNGADATPEAALAHLQTVMAAQAARADAPWSQREDAPDSLGGEYLNQLWSGILNELVENRDRGDELLAFVNSPEIDTLLAENQELLELVMDPAIMTNGREGQVLRRELRSDGNPRKLGAVFEEVEELVGSSGLLTDDENLDELLETNFAALRERDAALPEDERIVPEDLDEQGVGPDRENSCMEMIAEFFQMILGGGNEEEQEREQPAADATNIAIPDSLAEALRQYDADTNGLSAQELAAIPAADLPAILETAKAALQQAGVDVSQITGGDFNRDGTANAEDLRHGLAELNRRAAESGRSQE
jgi:hypothetical protein